MSMCPYKWFLYLASLWAVIYVMLEAYMQYRAANTSLQKEGFESFPIDSENDQDEEDDIDEQYVGQIALHNANSHCVGQRTSSPVRR